MGITQMAKRSSGWTPWGWPQTGLGLMRLNEARKLIAASVGATRPIPDLFAGTHLVPQ
jgi:hypothetical protein